MASHRARQGGEGVADRPTLPPGLRPTPLRGVEEGGGEAHRTEEETLIAVELLPAIDRLGIRIVSGDRVVFDRGTATERSGVVTAIDGVRVTVRLTHLGKREIPASTQAAHSNWRDFETTCANEVEVLR